MKVIESIDTRDACVQPPAKSINKEQTILQSIFNLLSICAALCPAWWLCTIGFWGSVSMSRIWANLQSRIQSSATSWQAAEDLDFGHWDPLLRISPWSQHITVIPRDGWTHHNDHELGIYITLRKTSPWKNITINHEKMIYRDIENSLFTKGKTNKQTNGTLPLRGWLSVPRSAPINPPSMDQDIRVATNRRCEMHVPEAGRHTLCVQRPSYQHARHRFGSLNRSQRLI